MSVRDKANQANSHEGGNYTKLASDVYLRCKAKDGKGHFEVVVNEEKKTSSKPIVGYLVGQAMLMSAYDEKSGDSMFSAPYYTNKKIALFLRAGKKVMHLLNGTKQQCEDKAYEMRFQGKFKTRKLYYVAAFDPSGNPKIYCIETNLPMAIELQKKINPTVFADYLFSFTPKIFDRNMKLSDNCKDALKPLFLPSNAHMEMGYTDLIQADPLTDEFENEMKAKGLNLEEVLDNFITWKKDQGVEETQKTETAQETPQYNTEMPAPQYQQYYTGNNDVAPTVNQDDDLDLPF